MELGSHTPMLALYPARVPVTPCPLWPRRPRRLGPAAQEGSRLSRIANAAPLRCRPSDARRAPSAADSQAPAPISLPRRASRGADLLTGGAAAPAAEAAAGRRKRGGGGGGGGGAQAQARRGRAGPGRARRRMAGTSARPARPHALHSAIVASGRQNHRLSPLASFRPAGWRYCSLPPSVKRPPRLLVPDRPAGRVAPGQHHRAPL